MSELIKEWHYLIRKLEKRRDGDLRECPVEVMRWSGKHWEQFAPRLYRHLVKPQDGDGKWRAYGTHHYGPLYSTSMYTLALTVTYRQLPIYQR